MRKTCLLLIIVSVTGFSTAFADDPPYRGPLFDTHMHYSSSAWPVFSTKDVFEKMKQANVVNALVSSTPDDGTSTLMAAASGRMISGLRPYRNSAEKLGWFKKPELLAYSKRRLAPRGHRAFGEVILNYVSDLDTPEMGEYLNIARDQGLIIHFHTGADVIEALLNKRPELKILWAHAGFNEPASVIGRLMGQYPNLWAELSYRADDIMGGSDLEPEWRSLLLKYSKRFTVGSDTWENGRWRNYEYVVDQHRQWLGKLPKSVAEKIALGNAKRLFGKVD